MRRISSIVTVALVALSTAASAQRGRSPSSSHMDGGATPIELGADASLSFGFGAPAGAANTTVFDIPLSQLRAGFFLSPALSVEPTFRLQHVSADGSSRTQYAIGVGALYHFSTIRSASQIYVRPFLNFESSSVSGNGVSASRTGVALGAGLGIKIPAADRFAYRFEANLAHNNNRNFDDSTNRLGLLAGISYFTH